MPLQVRVDLELGPAATHMRMLPTSPVVPILRTRPVEPTDCPMCGYTWPGCGCAL